MFNPSLQELLLVFLVALLVAGPARLPEIAFGAGRALAKLRSLGHSLTSLSRDITDSLDHIDSPFAANEGKDNKPQDNRTPPDKD